MIFREGGNIPHRGPPNKVIKTTSAPGKKGFSERIFPRNKSLRPQKEKERLIRREGNKGRRGRSKVANFGGQGREGGCILVDGCILEGSHYRGERLS